MAYIYRDGIMLCACCAMAAANADVSGCEDGLNHASHALSEPMDAGTLVVGDHVPFADYFDCYGCGEVCIGEGFKAAVLRDGGVRILRDGEVLETVATEDDAFAWLLRHQGQSVSYALEHGGYSFASV